jgi:hypothetical protein
MRIKGNKMEDKYIFDWWSGYIAIICMFLFGVCEGCVVSLSKCTPQSTEIAISLMFVGFIFCVVACIFYSSAPFQRKDID